MREEHRFRVFGNKVLRIFGPEREEIGEGWRTSYNKVLRL
jgi:hypothetical protein